MEGGRGGSGLGLWEFNRGSRRLPQAAMSSNLPVLFDGMACTRTGAVLKVSIFNKTNKQKANEEVNRYITEKIKQESMLSSKSEKTNTIFSKVLSNKIMFLSGILIVLRFNRAKNG